MFNTIRNRFQNYLYDKDTGNMLNYLTLSVKDKEIEKDIAEERAERVNKYYWIIFVCSFIGFIIQIYLLLKQSVEIHILIHYSCLLISVTILGIVRCWVKWAARIIFPVYFMVFIALEITVS